MTACPFDQLPPAPPVPQPAILGGPNTQLPCPEHLLMPAAWKFWPRPFGDVYGDGWASVPAAAYIELSRIEPINDAIDPPGTYFLARRQDWEAARRHRPAIISKLHHQYRVTVGASYVRLDRKTTETEVAA